MTKPSLPFIQTAPDHSVQARVHHIDVEQSQVPVLLHRDDERVHVPSKAIALSELLRPAPRRAIGTATCDTREAFVAHVNRMKGEHTALWAKLRGGITAIFDYHAPGRPSWMDLRATFIPTYTPQFIRWGKEQKLSPEDLVELFDEHFDELVAPPGSEKGTSPLELRDAFKAVHIEGKSVRKSYDHVRGRIELNVTDGGASGGKDKHDLPHVFWVGVPVFEGEFAIAMEMRIYYAGEGVFKVRPHNKQPTIDHAHELIRKAVHEDTELPIVLGEPEPPVNTVEAIARASCCS